MIHETRIKFPKEKVSQVKYKALTSLAPQLPSLAAQTCPLVMFRSKSTDWTIIANKLLHACEMIENNVG